ncbi:MAG: hypothetical protein LBE82_08685, partial [Chitinophagaceae bacterium]|nr:hypothetical protein [Chitinophagaceae bacterium]
MEVVIDIDGEVVNVLLKTAQELPLTEAESVAEVDVLPVILLTVTEFPDGAILKIPVGDIDHSRQANDLNN